MGCPPAGSFTQPPTRQCRYDFVCPWCWMRQVVGKVYDRFAWSIFGLVNLRHNPPPVLRCDLVLLMRERILGEDDYINPQDLFHEARHTAQTICQGTDSVYGAYSLLTLEPAVVASGYLAKERFLLLSEPGTDYSWFPAEYGGQVQIIAAPHVSAYTMAEMVGRTCEYASGLMLADPRDALDVIKIRSREPNAKSHPPNASEYWGRLRLLCVYEQEQACRKRYEELYGSKVDAPTAEDAG
jgi:hypothetical protein